MTDPYLFARSLSLKFVPDTTPLLRVCRQCSPDDGLCFRHDAAQMILSTKALRIDLVDVFGAGRTSREPAALCHHLQPADGSAVARRVGEDSLDFFARQFGELNLLG